MNDSREQPIAVDAIPGVGFRASIGALLLDVAEDSVELSAGTVRAVVTVMLDGVLLHKDYLNLTRDKDRTRFIEAVADKEPGATELGRVLIAVEEAIRSHRKPRPSDSSHAESAHVESSPPVVSIGLDTPLLADIREVMLDKEIKSFDKPRFVTYLVSGALAERGGFVKSREGDLFFFHLKEHRLYSLDAGAFLNFLSEVTGLSPSEWLFRFVHRMLLVRADRLERPVDVHTASYFDPNSGFLAVSDGTDGVWMRERHGEWTLAQNGDNGLLFTSDLDADSCTPDFSGGAAPLDWLLSKLLLADNPLSVQDQRALLRTNLLHDLFPSLRHTRMIPAFLGPQGSGKTTGLKLIGRTLLGPRFDVTSLNREREDAFVAAVSNRSIVAIDNADSRVVWLEDALATYATGTRYRMRKLYTTNEEESHRPRAKLMLSSRDPRFRRPDVAERLIPLRFERPEAYEDEGKIFLELSERRPAVLGALLAEAARIADALPDISAPLLPFRMADYAAFGWRVAALDRRHEEWVRILGRLEQAQAGFASEGDGLIEALRDVLMRNGGALPETYMSNLFAECFETAEMHKLAFPRTLQGFGQALTAKRRVIELELGVRVTEIRGHGGVRRVAIAPLRTAAPPVTPATVPGLGTGAGEAGDAGEAHAGSS